MYKYAKSKKITKISWSFFCQNYVKNCNFCLVMLDIGKWFVLEYMQEGGLVMKKVMYTILSVLSIIYIVFLALHVINTNTDWNPNMGWFAKWFELIVNFGGIAIIFCFALVNFAGSPLKTVFFILLIAAIVLYVIVLATPDSIYKLFTDVTPPVLV